MSLSEVQNKSHSSLEGSVAFVAVVHRLFTVYFGQMRFIHSDKGKFKATGLTLHGIIAKSSRRFLINEIFEFQRFHSLCFEVCFDCKVKAESVNASTDRFLPQSSK